MFMGMGKATEKGDNIILAAFGGGFTWGATWVKWRIIKPKTLNFVFGISGIYF